jgi:hypothetical protein
VLPGPFVPFFEQSRADVGIDVHLDKVGPVLEERKDTCRLDDFSQVYDAFDAIFKVNMQAMALTV